MKALEGSRDLTEPVTYSKREVRMIILVVILGWAFEFYNLQILSLYAVEIMQSFQISKGVFGALSSTALLFTAFGGIVFGSLADRYGRKNLLALTILLFSVSTVLIIFAKRIEMVFILRALTGIGIGGEWAVGFSLLNEAWTPRYRGLMGGIVQAAIWPAYIAAIFVSQVFEDWHLGFALGGIPIILAVGVFLYVPESKVWDQYNKLRLAGKLPGELARKAGKSPLIQIFQKDIIRYTLLGTLIAFGAQYAYYSMSQWLPTLLTEDYNLAVAAKNKVLYLGAGTAFISHIAAGGLSDIFGRKRTFMAFAICLLISFVAFAYVNLFSKAILLFTISYVLVNFGFGFFGIFGVWFSEIFPTRARAAGSSFAYGMGRGIASLGPLIVGLLATTNNNLFFGISTGVFAIILMIGALPFMRENKGKELSSLD